MRVSPQLLVSELHRGRIGLGVGDGCGGETFQHRLRVRDDDDLGGSAAAAIIAASGAHQVGVQ